MLGVPDVIVGTTWVGYESSRPFLESPRVKLNILELEERKQLLVDPNAPLSEPS